MSKLPAKNEQAEPVDRLLERVIIGGDLAGLTPLEKTKHYIRVCHSVGLNANTQPFAYLKLQGKETLYATKGATDQLRQIHSISIEILSRELVDGIYTVRARSSDPTGRHDEDEGIVPLADTVKGEFRTNLMMKCVTKAKRRVTLSHCGLGMLDESEIESIRDAKTEPGPDAKQLSLAEEMQDEIPDFAERQALPTEPDASASAAAATTPSPVEPAAATIERFGNVEDTELEAMAREAAMRGRDHLVKFFNSRNSKEKQQLRKIERDLVELYPTEGSE